VDRVTFLERKEFADSPKKGFRKINIAMKKA